MTKSVRFGTFLREIRVEQRRLSFNVLVPEVSEDAAGSPRPYQRANFRLMPREVYQIIEPYVSQRFGAQLKAVVPLAVYLVLFQLLILRQNIADSWTISAGLLAVMVGLMLFIEGLKVGLMPFGETIGGMLPRKSTLPFVLFIAFLLGIGVTFAEPAIGALKAAGSIVSVEKSPYLYALLNDWSTTLVLLVGVGVGFAAVFGTLRFLYGWSLKPLIYVTLVPTIGLTVYIANDPALREVLGLAWDCGAVTTGPVTVPLVLSLGIGIAHAAGKQNSSLSGFGIVTLASLFPIIAVQLLAIYVAANFSPEEIIASATSAQAASSIVTLPWYSQTPMVEVISGVRAILPLVVFLFLVLTVVLRERVRHPGIIAYGIVLSVLGMILFSLGLSYGLSKLGGQSGSLVPAAFVEIALVHESPLYSFTLGLVIAGGFALVLGFGATLAEPALNALGLTVENLTNGAFKKSLLMYAVSSGVGLGIAIGVMKMVFEIPIAYLVVPGYLAAVVLTALSTEDFVNIAWDSAGVTTGPVTVPLVLAMGLGFGDAMGAAEGFGILAMASIGPILAVLATGLWIQRRIQLRHEADLRHETEEHAVYVTRRVSS